MRGLRPGLPLYWSAGFILLCFFSFSSSSQPTVQGTPLLACNSKDRDGLVAFSESLDSGVPDWPREASSSNCCRWPGVRCSVSSSSKNSSGASETRVVALELGKKGLKGSVGWTTLLLLDELRTLNLSQNSLSGVISAPVFRLRQLEVLDLSSNLLSGELSDGIGSLSSLRHLDISSNDFSGAIPNTFDGLSELRRFSARSNNLSGPLPASLSSCSMLTSLDLGNNSLTGKIGLDLSRLVRLRTIRLDWNNFYGRIPRVAVARNSSLGMNELRTLDLSQNSFSGVISEELFRLQRLELLDLSGNHFSGELRDGIRNLSALRHLDISDNNFTGTLPDTFDGLRKLQLFSARSNGFTSPLPASLSSCSMLTLLDLGNNSLSGRIGLDFTRLVHLRSLFLDSNRFVGHVPRSLSSCRELKILNLEKNNLHGPIPLRLKNLQALASLSLSGNALTNVSRAFAVLSQCRNMTVLLLRGSFRGEVMPGEGIGGFESLEVLLVDNCSLSGTIPSWLRNCVKLRLLHLSLNRLTGDIPAWLGDFVGLFLLDLSNNSLSGVLPSTLANLKSLASPNYSRIADFSVGLPLPARRTRYSAGAPYIPLYFFARGLDLSSNRISGPILKGFGNLTGLMFFNLSNNYLSGPIPEELSEMRNLESLDLSHNNLSGGIPSSLVRLTFLAVFSVAYNHLQGEVPSTRQFSTFARPSYEGNPGLCGWIINASCGSTRVPALPTPPANDTDTEAEEFRSITFMPLPYGIGVLIGFIPTVICGYYCGYRRRKKKERQE